MPRMSSTAGLVVRCGAPAMALVLVLLAVPGGSAAAQLAGSSRPVIPYIGARADSGAANPPAVLDSAGLEREATRRHAAAPLARALADRTGKPALARRVAEAIVREAERIRVAPSLLAGILLTENRRLETRAVGIRGAVGLMQIMPFHAGHYGCASRDLHDVDANICHGAGIFGRLFARARRLDLALTRYNGCRGGPESPRCRRYPTKVLAMAGGIRRDLLAHAAAADSLALSGAADTTSAAAPPGGVRD